MAISPHTAQTLSAVIGHVDSASELIAAIGGVTNNTANMGIVTATTPPLGTNTLQVPTTAFIQQLVFSLDSYYSTAGGL